MSKNCAMAPQAPPTQTKHTADRCGAFREYAKQLITRMAKYYCPCCGYDTLTEEPPGTFNICPICFWEDDPIQYKDPTYKGGANRVSLIQGQMNFEKYGACEKEMVKNTVKPTKDCKRAPTWKKY